MMLPEVELLHLRVAVFTALAGELLSRHGYRYLLVSNHWYMCGDSSTLSMMDINWVPGSLSLMDMVKCPGL